jgi:outer membrane immunogenic protein
MLKEISSIALLSLSFSTPSYSGFYVGGGIGPEGAAFYQRAHITGNSGVGPVDVNTTGAFNVIATNNLSGTGGFGTVFAGYGWRHQLWYLAGEINANLSSVKYKLTNDEYIHQNFAQTFFTIRTSEAITVLPGYFLTNSTLLYGRVGYANGRLKIFEGADPSIQNMNRNVNGVRYGLGISQELSSKWAIRLDYSQINYAHVNSFTSFPDAGVTKTTEITPNTAQIAFDLVYRFDHPVIYTK